MVVEEKDRFKELEEKIYETKTEIKVISSTLSEVSNTLKEIKEDQRSIKKFEIEKAILERDIEDQKKHIVEIFTKLDVIKDDITSLKEYNANSSAKINISERVIWLIITMALGIFAFLAKKSIN